MSGRPELRLDWATHEAAAFACRRWHYSRTMPVPPRIYIGVWEDEQFIGVVLFSRGASPYLFSAYGVSEIEGCELTRIALTAHESPVSRIVSIAVRMVAKQNPGLRLVVSFADPMHGHHGGIYQAGGWIYCGDTHPDFYHQDASGKKWHSRQVRKNGAPVKQFGRFRAMPRPDDMTYVETLGKHRYLMPLDAEMRARILPLARPYPKRAKEQAPEHPSGLGGAAPTRALQKH